MVEFGSLGSLNEFANRTGQDPASRPLLGRYTAALATGHRIWDSEGAGTTSHAMACFVKSIDTAGETFVAVHYDASGKPQELPHLLDTETVDDSDLAELNEGTAFWLKTTRIEDLEVDGLPLQRHDLEIVVPH